MSKDCQRIVASASGFSGLAIVPMGMQWPFSDRPVFIMKGMGRGVIRPPFPLFAGGNS